MSDSLPTSAPAAVIAAGDGMAALLTVGISVYAAAILIGVGLGISYARRQRPRSAAVCAAVVGVLTLVGVILAVVSSIA